MVITSHNRRKVIDLYAAATRELSHQHFHVVDWFSHQNQDYQVGYHKGSTAILQGGERKAPDISQAHAQGDAGHEELEIAVPGWTCLALLTSRLHSARLDTRRSSWKSSFSFLGGDIWVILWFVRPGYRDCGAHKGRIQVAVVVIVICCIHVAAANQSKCVIALTFTSTSTTWEVVVKFWGLIRIVNDQQSVVRLPVQWDKDTKNTNTTQQQKCQSQVASHWPTDLDDYTLHNNGVVAPLWPKCNENCIKLVREQALQPAAKILAQSFRAKPVSWPFAGKRSPAYWPGFLLQASSFCQPLGLSCLFICFAIVSHLKFHIDLLPSLAWGCFYFFPFL